MAFDHAIIQLSAATIDAILTYIYCDALNVHHDMIYHALVKGHKRMVEDAKSHVIAALCEIAHTKPAQLIDIITTGGWRYWFARFARNKVGSTQSQWYRQHIRPDKTEQVAEDDHPTDDAFTLDDLMSIAGIATGPTRDEELAVVMTNLSVLLRDVEWADQRLYAIYHFDVLGWAKEDIANGRKGAKMSYRYIAKRTGIPHQAVARAVTSVHQYIAANYPARFGPIPPHLIS